VRTVSAVTCNPSGLVYVATIADWPAPVIVARPVRELIVATVGVLEVQVEDVVRFSVSPVPVVPTTANPKLGIPVLKVGLEGDIVIETTSEVLVDVGAFTVNVEALLIMSPLKPGMLAVIWEKPIAEPVTVAIPELFTVTSSGV
jgi:hypothetical protein